LLLSAIL